MTFQAERFIITLVILIGTGLLMYAQGVPLENTPPAIATTWGMLLTFWFVRQAPTGANNGS